MDYVNKHSIASMMQVDQSPSGAEPGSWTMQQNVEVLPAHGGDIYRYKREPGRELLDFSSNISPLGLPAGVVACIVENASHFDIYPDPHCSALRSELALHHQVAAECIVCGNGAADLIFRVVQSLRPKKALLLAPGFSEYEKALMESGAICEFYALSYPHFEVEEDLINYITPELDIVFLCNPNNPTGILVKPAIMQELIRRTQTCDVVLVVDECFIDLLDEPQMHSVASMLSSSPHLAVLKAFTKTYAMAGIRLGYLLCGSAQLAASVQDIGQAWSVSTLAQKTGLQALKEKDYIRELRSLISSERARMCEALNSIAGIEVLGGSANYLFFRMGGNEAGLFAERMKDFDILVRSCGNYHGLNSSYYRVAVRKPTENEALIRAVQAAMQKTASNSTTFKLTALQPATSEKQGS